MKATHTGTPGKDWFLADGQCTFSGPPRQCRGELTLINDSDDKVKIRALETRAPARKRKGMQALEPQQIRFSAQIPPHDLIRKRVNLKLPQARRQASTRPPFPVAVARSRPRSKSMNTGN